MAYLGKIVRHLEDVFQIKIEGTWNDRARIEGIRILPCGPARTPKEPSLEDQLLYIGDFENGLSARRPQNLLITGPCEPLPGANILYIRERIDTAQLFNAVQEVIFMYNIQKQKQEELFRSLHGDHGIEGMAHVAHACLATP